MKVSFSDLRIFFAAVSLLIGLISFQPQKAQADEIASLQSYNFQNMYWRQLNFDARIDANVNPAIDSQWKIVPGLASSATDYVSFESVAFPGYYLRHYNFDFLLAQNDGTSAFAADATFKKVSGLKDATWSSFQSYNFPTRYIRHSSYLLRLDPISTDIQKQDATFKINYDDCAGIGTSAADIAALQTCTGSPTVCTLGGNDGTVYNVKMKFNNTYTAPIEVFAESRRRMFLDTPASKCVNTLVDVRNYLFEGEPLQARDPGISGLNLRIAQGTGNLTAVSVTPVTNPPMLFIAGDSTVADQPPQWDLAANLRYTGWGGMIPKFFNNKIAVINYADSGESTAAFRVDGGTLWWYINNRLKANDWLLIQLGHNDKTTGAALYHSRILGMINAAKAKGAFPVLVTPMVRNNGVALADQHIYGDLNVRNEMISLASSENIPLIDLMKISSEWVASVGRTTAQTYFVTTDVTHSNELGAQLFAQMIADEMRVQNIGLVGYMR